MSKANNLSVLEKQVLVDLYVNKKISIGEISKSLNFSRYVLSRNLKTLGVVVENRQNLLSWKIPDIVKLINDGKSLTRIAIELKTNRNTLARHLKANNIAVINHQNKSKFNCHVFDTIDTEEKAYWLGFCFSDGYISLPVRKTGKHEYNFEITLAIIDCDHLIKFNKFMNHNKVNVKISETRCRFSISNRHFWTVLNNYGCIPQKSLKLKFPDIKIFKDKGLLRHFIRGYIDGDGCLYFNKNPSLSCVSVNGTQDFLINLQNNLNIEKRNMVRFVNGPDTISLVSFGGKTGKMVLEYLYSNCEFYLERKFNKYQQIMSCQK